MEKTIGRLLEIDEQAKSIIRRANEEKIKLHEEFENDLEKMEKDIADDNYQKINNFKIEVEKQLSSEENLLLSKINKQLHELDENYQKNHETMVSRIVESILLFESD